MGKREGYCTVLAPLVASAVADLASAGPVRDLALARYLTAESNLPGPRGNLELAAAFGDVVGDAASAQAPDLWSLCISMAAMSPAEAPVETPEVMLPFSAAVGIGALGAAVDGYAEDALVALRTLARDPRWRIREGVCFGLQRLLATRATRTLAALTSLVADGDPLEMRAAAAAVADPPLLASPEIAREGLALHRDILDAVVRWPRAARRDTGFTVLRQGLSFTLSVVVSAMPDTGFVYLRALAAVDDPDVARILRENLKKKRLVGPYPEDVEGVQALLRRSTA